jgi:glycosyltransferase involved in cell wall biosynthesis
MKVSVAMTTYNGIPFLSEQIDSILEQSRQPNQVVVCDDGSRDGTVATLREYESSYPDLFDVYVNDTNLGVSKNFEKAIRLAEGDLICICDQDDIWNANKIERQIDAHAKTGKWLICHDSLLTTQDLDPIESLWTRNEYTSGRVRDIKDGFEELVYGTNFIQGATMMLDSELKEYILPIPETWQYDYYIALVASIVGGIHDIDEELLLYRQHEDQDLGAPKRTFLANALYSLREFDYSYIRDRAEGWVELSEQVQSIPESNLLIDKDVALSIVNTRAGYESHRATARNPNETYPNRLRAVFENYQSDSYTQFGAGILSACRDIASLVAST